MRQDESVCDPTDFECLEQEDAYNNGMDDDIDCFTDECFDEEAADMGFFG